MVKTATATKNKPSKKGAETSELMASMDKVPVGLFDPKDIVVDHEANSRASLHTDEDVDKMAKSFEDQGQLDAVLVRENEEGKPELVAGYLRYSAAVKFNKDNPDKPMKLECKFVKRNTEESFLTDVITNLRRKNTTPVDDAAAQKRMREEMGKSDKWIANFYGISQGYVSQLKNVYNLSDDARERLHGDEFSWNVALLLAKESTEDQDEIIKLALAEREDEWADTKEGKKGKEFPGTVDTDSVKSAIRTFHAKDEATDDDETPDDEDGPEDEGSEDDEGDETPTKEPKVTRSLKNVKDFFLEQSGPGETENMRRLCAIMADLFDGQDEAKVIKRLNALLDGEEEPTFKKKKKKDKKAAA
jgi:ParB/RepB/Spo0J family partition protein